MVGAAAGLLTGFEYSAVFTDAGEFLIFEYGGEGVSALGYGRHSDQARTPRLVGSLLDHD